VTLNAWITTARGRLLDRLLGGDTLRGRLRKSECDVNRLVKEVVMWRRRAEVAEIAVKAMRRRRTD